VNREMIRPLRNLINETEGTFVVSHFS